MAKANLRMKGSKRDERDQVYLGYLIPLEEVVWSYAG